MWPADSRMTSSLPQLAANRFARSRVTKGSFVLTTATDLKGNRSSGYGANPVGPTGIVSASTSGGETRSAAATRLFPLQVPAAQWMTAAHPILWATSTTGESAAAIAVSRFFAQSEHRGCCHSSCCTRRYSGWRASHKDCQCVGPESPSPGIINTERGDRTFILCSTAGHSRKKPGRNFNSHHCG